MIIQKHRLLDVAFAVNTEDLLAEINIAHVECNQGTQSNAGAKQETEHKMVSFSYRTMEAFDSGEERLNLRVGKIAWWFPSAFGQSYQPGRIVFEVACLDEECEERPIGRLHPINGNRGSRLAVGFMRERLGCQVPGDVLWSNVAHLGIPTKPLFKRVKVSNINSPGVSAFPISP